jgi:hypothetical protein
VHGVLLISMLLIRCRREHFISFVLYVYFSIFLRSIIERTPLKITWKSRDSTSVMDLERRLTEYPPLNGFDKCIHSIERFATSVPLIEKAR